MGTTIHLTGKEPLVARLCALVEYTGRKIRLETRERVNTARGVFPDGGSFSTYTAVRLDTLDAASCPRPTSPFAPYNPDQYELALAPGMCVIERAHFCGKDFGVYIYVHPSGLAPLLPPSAEVSRDEQIVLYATRTYKNSYAGRTDRRFAEARAATRITMERWECARASLIARKLLNKSGAITVAGRNAVASLHRFPGE